jgi:hypothetical protein
VASLILRSSLLMLLPYIQLTKFIARPGGKAGSMHQGGVEVLSLWRGSRDPWRRDCLPPAPGALLRPGVAACVQSAAAQAQAPISHQGSLLLAAAAAAAVPLPPQSGQ